MTDRVFIRHPAYPDRNGYATLTAYENLWSKKGYVIEGDTEPVTGPGEVGESGPEIVAVTADDVVEAWNRAASSPPSQDHLNAELDEKAQLRAELERRGVEVDGRWGLKRLRAEAANVDIGDPSAEPTDETTS